MNSEWKTEPLGNLVYKRTDFTIVDPDVFYDIVGVQRSGWGLVGREAVRGSAMKFTKLMQLEAENLVFRTITAFEAPSTVVNEQYAGTFVTPQTFPVFTIDKSRLLPAYMKLITTVPSFHRAMAERCTGTVVRRKTLSVSAFCSIPISVPPLGEQRRMVDLIAALDSSIEAAAEAASALDRVRSNLTQSLLKDKGAASQRVKLSEVMSLDVEKVKVTDGKDYPVVGVLNRGRGLLLRDSVNSRTTKYMDLYRVRPGQVVYSKLKAFEGAITVAPADLDERFASTEFPTFTCGDNLLPEFFRLRTTQPDFWQQMATFSKGMGGRRERLSPADFLTLELSIPSIADQEAAVAILAAVEETISETIGQQFALANLRSELISALTSQAHRIPETYDELMGV